MQSLARPASFTTFHTNTLRCILFVRFFVYVLHTQKPHILIFDLYSWQRHLKSIMIRRAPSSSYCIYYLFTELFVGFLFTCAVCHYHAKGLRTQKKRIVNLFNQTVKFSDGQNRISSGLWSAQWNAVKLFASVCLNRFLCAEGQQTKKYIMSVMFPFQCAAASCG